MARDIGDMADPFTKELLETCEFGSEECRYRLLAIALLSQTNIVQNECTNALLRRLIKQRPQTTQASVAELATRAAGMFTRQAASFDLEPLQATPPPAGPAPQPVPKADAAPRARTGGAYRAFLHQQHTMSGPASAAAYHALDGAQAAALRLEGQEATQRGRAGVSPFGPQARDMKRMLDRRVAQQALVALGDMSREDRVSRVLEDARALNHSVDETVATLRRMDKAQSLAIRKQEAADALELQQYRKDVTPQTVRDLQVLAPKLVHAQDTFLALPPHIGRKCGGRDDDIFCEGGV